MKLISLITDFGLNDNFVGLMKAVILKINPHVRIVDICHEVASHDIFKAALLLRSSFRYFPHGTVHVAVVDPGVGSRRKKVLVKTKNYFFIAPDNGILSLALKEEPPICIIELTREKYFLKPISDTFAGRDIFSPVAAYVSKGIDISRFGRKIKSLNYLQLPAIKVSNKDLVGEIIYVDRFGNLVSNISRDSFEGFVRHKKFKIKIKNKTIDKLSHSYSEGSRQKPIALIDSFNYLEIALNSDSANVGLGAGIGTKIILTVS